MRYSAVAVVTASLCSATIAIAAPPEGAKDTPKTFTVEDVPNGGEPDWVREAWVGLRLPYVDIGQFGGVEVLSGKPVPRAWSYSVSEDDALRVLEKTAPKAAQWWRETPHIGGTFYFRFNLSADLLTKAIAENLNNVIVDTRPIQRAAIRQAARPTAFD
jgi:hypothetical protein